MPSDENHSSASPWLTRLFWTGVGMVSAEVGTVAISAMRISKTLTDEASGYHDTYYVIAPPLAGIIGLIFIIGSQVIDRRA